MDNIDNDGPIFSLGFILGLMAAILVGIFGCNSLDTVKNTEINTLKQEAVDKGFGEWKSCAKDSKVYTTFVWKEKK